MFSRWGQIILSITAILSRRLILRICIAMLERCFEVTKIIYDIRESTCTHHSMKTFRDFVVFVEPYQA